MNIASSKREVPHICMRLLTHSQLVAYTYQVGVNILLDLSSMPMGGGHPWNVGLLTMLPPRPKSISSVLTYLCMYHYFHVQDSYKYFPSPHTFQQNKLRV